ncbi:hypothetical protein [Acinetobacter calcoaceticus]|uniref:hypothetical protein n=1 Tax=Acinetobacter calcoaceticus TaxID=471 RepID=UPI0005E700E0|nr:hypothetical protein [Acinetobacter calcoaceticus]KJH57014.1 hypothetical protein UF12_14050 [Acinetobacter calcoaceticus]
MRKILEILKSKEQRWILIVAVITAIALAIALPFGYINLVKVVFNFFVRISPLEFILFIPLFFLLFNVIFKWKINLILIGLCSFFSKKIVNSLNCFVGFCLPLFLMNLGFNHIPDALFFATIGLTTYLIAIASHWIILDLETQSNDLIS